MRELSVSELLFFFKNSFNIMCRRNFKPNASSFTTLGKIWLISVYSIVAFYNSTYQVTY